MAGASLDEADLPKIARAAGESGKPLPAWAKGKPELEAAHRAGAGLPDPGPEPAPEPDAATATPSDDTDGGSPASDAAGPQTPRKGSGARRATPSKKQPQRVTTAVKGAAADLVEHPATLGSDGGGLMLAIFIYPIVLAILQHGPNGAVLWLKAKFLNQGSGQPSTTSSAGGSSTNNSSGGLVSA